MKLNELRCVCDNIDIEKYIEFMDRVKKNMEHPDWLGDFSKEDIQKLLSIDSKIWIYYDGDNEVCSMMFIPSDEKTLKKFGIDKDYKDTMEIGPMFVDIKYVGNNLQYQMLKVMDEYAISKGYTYSASTIHPDNIYSINNFLKDNFKYIGQHTFSRGIRNIYLKEL